MSTKKNEIAVQDTNTSLTTFEFTPEADAYGTEGLNGSDIRIPRVLLAQKMSPITDKPGSGLTPGDLWDSITEEKIGDKGQLFSFIPIHIFKTLTLQKMINGKYEFQSSHAWVPAFANAPYEYETAEGKFKNMTNINVLAIKETDLGNPAALPVTISFRSTSLNCGKDIIADCLQAKAKGASSAQLTISIVSEIQTNDKGSYYVFKKKAPRLTKDYVDNKEIFKNWFELFSSGKAKIDEDKEETSQSNSGDTFTRF